MKKQPTIEQVEKAAIAYEEAVVIFEKAYAICPWTYDSATNAADKLRSRRYNRFAKLFQQVFGYTHDLWPMRKRMLAEAKLAVRGIEQLTPDAVKLIELNPDLASLSVGQVNAMAAEIRSFHEVTK